MAVSVSNLVQNGTGVAATSFATASISPAPNKLIILATHARVAGGTPPQPTATGCSLTWVVIGSVTYAAGANVKRLTVFRALGSAPTSGAVTVSYGSTSCSHASWVVDQLSGVNTSGTNGSGAIVQSVTKTDSTGVNTSFAVTLGSFSNNQNITYGAISDENNTGLTKGANFTLSGQGASVGGNTITEYELVNDTNVNATDSPATSFGGVALEILPGNNPTTFNNFQFVSAGNGISVSEKIR